MALGRIKRVKDGVQFVRRNTGACVGNRYFDRRVAHQRSTDRQLALAMITIAHGVDPVHRQIYKRLLQLNTVGANPQRPVWPVGVKFDSVP